MLVPPESSSAVLVMIRSKSVSICNHSRARLVDFIQNVHWCDANARCKDDAEAREDDSRKHVQMLTKESTHPHIHTITSQLTSLDMARRDVNITERYLIYKHYIIVSLVFRSKFLQDAGNSNSMEC